MKVGITGGNGFIGKKIILELLEKHMHIISMQRSSQNIDGVEIMSKTLNVQNNFASFSISEIENGVYLLKSKIRQKIYKDKLIVVK